MTNTEIITIIKARIAEYERRCKLWLMSENTVEGCAEKVRWRAIRDELKGLLEVIDVPYVPLDQRDVIP